MNIAEVITAERTRIETSAPSRKRVLQQLAALLADGTPYLTTGEIFSALVAREKLGSTAIGHGIAMPHARVADIDECVGAILRLSDGIDFDADDGQPVDLIFGLLVPQHSDDTHADTLHELADMLAGPQCRTMLRRATDNKALVDALVAHDANIRGDV